MADGPVLSPTAKIPAEDIQRQLLDKLIVITTDIRTKVDDLGERVERVETNQGIGNDAIRTLEGRVLDIEKWRLMNSERVRGESKTNAAQDAAIASIITKVDTIERKTDTQTQMLAQLVKVASNPLVKDVVKVLVTALLTWAGIKGLQ